MGDEMVDRAHAAGFTDVEMHKDITEHERYMVKDADLTAPERHRPVNCGGRRSRNEATPSA